MTGKQFKKLRRSIEYSQTRLAAELDLYVRTISRYETDALKIPKVTKLALYYLVEQAKKKKGR
jgi:transcriptional regulator with XRE-family HTH domain